jgi:hypothetical protein
MLVEVIVLRKITACVPKSQAANDHDRADDALLHTNRAGFGSNRIKCSVELFPSMDQIFGDSEHPMTEIDLEAGQIYARVVGQVRGLFRCLKLGWINRIPARIIKLTSYCPA